MITDKQLQGLKPKKTKYRKSCGTRNNLYILIQPSGLKSFVFRFTDQTTGKIEQIHLGHYFNANDLNGLSLAGAIIKASGFFSMFKSGINPKQHLIELEQIESEKLTVIQAWNKYHDLYMVRKQVERTIKGNRYAVEKELFPLFGQKKIEDLTKKNLIHVFDAIKARGVGGQSAFLYRHLRAFLNWCAERDIISINPLKTIKQDTAGTPPQRRERYLSEDEIKHFWNWIESAVPDEHYKIVFKIMLLTAQRISQLRIARWENVNFEKSIWFVPKREIKRGKVDQLVFLSPIVLNLFKRLKELTGDSPYCVHGKDLEKHITEKPIQDSLKKALVKEGLDSKTWEKAQGSKSEFTAYFSTHSFRDTFSSLMYEKGYSGIAIEKILTHHLTGSMADYNHSPYHDLKKEVWLAWSNIIDSLVTDKKKVIDIDEKRRA